MLVLGRLAVAKDCPGIGLGSAMLRDAMRRCVEISQAAGVRMLIVHAIDDNAAGFYRQYGFKPLPGEALTLFLPIETMVGAM